VHRARQLERLAAGAAVVDRVDRIPLDLGQAPALGAGDEAAADAAIRAEGVDFFGQAAILASRRFDLATLL
jgi:hypothetical protein